ncbi:hypothetical protein Cgig2_007949 [Carnegiea gigantea]|uniref:RING-type E3 ubiquitin transferase n=1 Tax=Carnegiea gigantea TaxID=171969 RepID=A0A9Q1QHX4_9CARY|nr:hypothetical protein Cgig2_007949 [Carnegiea gigantea]
MLNEGPIFTCWLLASFLQDGAVFNLKPFQVGEVIYLVKYVTELLQLQPLHTTATLLGGCFCIQKHSFNHGLCIRKDTSLMMINGCMIQMYRYNTGLVQFPFRIRNQEEPLPNYCGYPGFDLFCDGANRLSIDLPNSGVFLIQTIDYVKQELLLNDPNNCLPERLLSLNHSNSGNYSPFVPMREQVYWLYNCSNDYLKSFSYMKKIECLSGSNYGVIATIFKVISNDSNSKCEKSGSIRVPGESGPELMSSLGSDLNVVSAFKKVGNAGSTAIQAWKLDASMLHEVVNSPVFLHH